MESEAKEVEKDGKTEEDFSSLKKKGDILYKEEKYEEALEYYNKAIEQDKSNLEVLSCRVEVYFKLKRYEECVKEAEKLVALCTNNKRKYKSLPAFNVFKYMGHAHTWLQSENTKEIYLRAMQIDVPASEVQPVIESYNVWTKSREDATASRAALDSGIMRYSCGNILAAIQEFTSAISLNTSDPLAYACRAACRAEDAGSEKDLIRDVKECIELDYRYLNYFIDKADEFKLVGQIDASFRLYKSLSLSTETYKLSVGRFFPKLLHNKQLNKSEKRRFKNLDEYWREHILPILEELNQDSDSEGDCVDLSVELR